MKEIVYTDKEITEFLKAANRDLGSGKYKAEQVIEDYAKTINIVKQLQAELEKHRWIPDTERLPEIPKGDLGTSDVVLVCNNNSRCFCEGFYDFESHNWDTDSELSSITHWKPIILPEQTSKEKLFCKSK